MTIRVTDYRRNKGKAGSAMVNIRLRRIGKRPPTKAETIKALEQLLDSGELPPLWQFMFIDWKNPQKTGTSWLRGMKTGDEGDLEEMHELIRAMLHSMKFRQVRDT